MLLWYGDFADSTGQTNSAKKFQPLIWWSTLQGPQSAEPLFGLLTQTDRQTNKQTDRHAENNTSFRYHGW